MNLKKFKCQYKYESNSDLYIYKQIPIIRYFSYFNRIRNKKE